MAGKSVKLDIGTVYKKDEDGPYFFRYQVNGQRKAVSLQTKNQQEALAKARDLVPVVRSTTVELISAHVKHARGLATARKGLALSDAFDAYSRHADRAMPATVNEREAYRTTLEEFAAAVCDASMAVSDVTPELADAFANHMRTMDISVSTHNRKIKRLRKLFSVLREYRDGENPFAAKSLMRKPREEQAQEIRRLSFTREQEEAMLEVLADTTHKVMHKPEVRVVYHVGMFTGQRFKDCIMLRWDKVDLNRRRIW